MRVECAEPVVRERIAAREGDESDADFAVYRLLEGEFDPVSDPTLTVDNSGALAETRARIRERF